jgi:hypothetical protein
VRQAPCPSTRHPRVGGAIPSARVGSGASVGAGLARQDPSRSDRQGRLTTEIRGGGRWRQRRRLEKREGEDADLVEIDRIEHGR